MRAAYAAARFREAAALYDRHAAGTAEIPADVVFVRARIALDADPASAVDLLLAHRAGFVQKADRLTAELLLGSSFAQLREFAAADAHFERARTLLDRRSLVQSAALAAARGRRYICESRIGDAWRCYESTLVDVRTEGQIESERLKGEIHLAESRSGEAADSLLRLLALMQGNIDAKLALWYRAVTQLAHLACELPAPAAAAAAADALAVRPSWSPDFAADRFQALRALAWRKTLAGDRLGSFRYLREAGAVAEGLGSAPLRAIVLLDRAFFARTAHEEHWCANELAAATDLLRDVDWARAGVLERTALPLFAEALAASDPDAAAAAIARYFTLSRTFDPVATAARGMVHFANGRTREAVRDLSAAYDEFDRLGSDWRAGKAALALAHATAHARWQLLALEKLEFYASSWLYEQAASLAVPPQSSGGSSLTPMQERVFNMICEGLSTDAIAARLGRSRSTVRNHLKLIFKALGVRSRSALVAKAARSGRFT